MAADPRLGPYAYTFTSDAGTYGPATEVRSGTDPNSGYLYWSSTNRYDSCVPKPTGTQFKGPFPVVIIIHGGGWSSGEKALYDLDCKYWASQGFYSISIDYRLQRSETGLGYPVTLVDAQLVIRWMRSKAATFNINPTAIACKGDSAGATMCEQTAWYSGIRANSGDSAVGLYTSYSSIPNYVIAEFGPAEFGGFSSGSHDSELTKALVTANYGANVPTMLVQGYQDTTVPRKNSHDIENVLVQHQLSVYYYEYFGVHEFVGNCTTSCPTPGTDTSGGEDSSKHNYFTHTYANQTAVDARTAEEKWLGSMCNCQAIPVSHP